MHFENLTFIPFKGLTGTRDKCSGAPIKATWRERTIIKNNKNVICLSFGRHISIKSSDLQVVVQERLTSAEIAEALQSGLRCGSELRDALLSGCPVSRGDLLGSRCNLEGLTRVSRSRATPLYELELGC